MKKLSIILLMLVYPIYGCNVDKESKNSVSSSSSVINSPSPSISTATPTITSTPELEKYCNNVYCEPISKEEISNPKLDKPFDVGVSSDGKKVFVMNRSKSKTIRYCNDINPKEIIKGQYIYEITEDKKISVVKVNGNYLYSCDFSDEIEVDSKNNIYFVKEELSKEKDFPKLVVSDEIYKLTPEKKLELFFKKITPTSSPTPTPHNVSLSNLKITNDGKDNIYFSMYGRDYAGSTQKLVMIDNGELKELLDNSSAEGGIGENYSADFLINRNKLIYPDLTMTDIPYGSVKKVFTSENGEKLYSKSNVQRVLDNGLRVKGMELDLLGNIYAITVNDIWKLTPKGELIKIAGNSTSGYKDGKGEEAMFNNPSNLSIDAQGNVYVADTGNNAIRKITPDGMVSTFYKND